MSDYNIIVSDTEFLVEIIESDVIVVEIDNGIAGVGGGGGTTSVLKKCGIVVGGSFSGTPKKYQVTFDTPYADDAYNINLSSEDARFWTYESKTANGFIINANANEVMTGETSWQTFRNGESGDAGSGTLKKCDIVSGAAFSGSPKKYTVFFNDPYDDDAYNIAISSEEARLFTYESKTAASFVINSNAAEAMTGEVSYQTFRNEETA
jgi:hypothetical protein